MFVRDDRQMGGWRFQLLGNENQGSITGEGKPKVIVRKQIQTSPPVEPV